MSRSTNSPTGRSRWITRTPGCASGSRSASRRATFAITKSPPCCSTSDGPGTFVKAVAFDRFGGAEVLEYREMPEPTPRATDVVVNVRGCGINHLDLWVRGGLPGLEIEMPHVLGKDVVGEVAAIG